MKKTAALILLCTLLLSLFPPAFAENEYVLYAASVGKADALLLKVNEYCFLIDTGYAASRGKILYGMELLGMDHLDGVFITHTDGDHIGGLEWLAESGIPIDNWYASALYTGVKNVDKHPVSKAAALRDASVTWLKAGDQFDLGDAELQVLAPGKQFSDTDNNNSLVMMLRTPLGNILLCGDMEYEEEAWLLKNCDALDCDVLKVANHADDDTGSIEFILAASPSLSVISTSTAEKPETPDAALVKRLMRNGSSIVQTQETDGGVMITLTAEGPRAEYISLPACDTDVYISSVDREEQSFIITNGGDAPADLSDWYLLTWKKECCLAFPRGAVLQPGESLRVAGRQTGGNVDVVWAEKKPVNPKKADGLSLYDRFGRLVSQLDNGIDED